MAVRQGGSSSHEIRFVCQAGSRIGFECGAHSIFGALLSPNTFSIRRV